MSGAHFTGRATTCPAEADSRSSDNAPLAGCLDADRLACHLNSDCHGTGRLHVTRHQTSNLHRLGLRTLPLPHDLATSTMILDLRHYTHNVWVNRRRHRACPASPARSLPASELNPLLWHGAWWIAVDSRAPDSCRCFGAEAANVEAFSGFCRRGRTGAKALAGTKPLENATEGPAR